MKKILVMMVLGMLAVGTSAIAQSHDCETSDVGRNAPTKGSEAEVETPNAETNTAKSEDG